MTIRLLTYALNLQSDVVGARQRARHLASLVGFDNREQTQIATSVSEIARNAFRYAGGGRVEFEIEGETRPQLLVVRVSDDGPGIASLDRVLDGTYESKTGMGIGLIGSRRLMDRWDIHSVPGRGTVVTLGKLLPERAPLVTPPMAGKLVSQLGTLADPTSLAEIQAQNAELLAVLADLQEKQQRLVELTHELEDTNRGVVALYAELDEKADHLRRADEMKSRFLSNMSHEFRTPLNSIRAICRLLLDHADGPLTAEQEMQVQLVAKSASGLGELVNDLLDLAKIEAGKTDVRPSDFEVAELFSALRGMLRPLLVTETVDLVFEDPVAVPTLHTDESKVSQILRNFISNALKFTERGEVRVSARPGEDGASVVFSVRDTGIGIAEEDLEVIFDEFTQVQSPLQRKVKGTGLGLPLCRRLAALLGGEVWVESRPGEGSTFHARILARHEADTAPAPVGREAEGFVPPEGAWVLVIDDDEATRVIYEKFLKGSRYAAVLAPSLAAGVKLMQASRPTAVVLDIVMPGEEMKTWRWLADAKAGEAPPVIVASQTGDARKARSLGADAYLEKPVDRAVLLATLDRVTAPPAAGLALIIDDDEAARYVIRRSLRGSMRFAEARDGASGLEAAARMQPGVIFLDLSMPDMNGDEVLQRLGADPSTAGIPVVIVTSHELDRETRSRLAEGARAIVQKKDLSVETLAGALAHIGSAGR